MGRASRNALDFGKLILRVLGRHALLMALWWGILQPLHGVAADSDDAQPAAAQSLAGNWSFRVDREDVGERERWFETRLAESIRLPGSTAEHGYGDDPSSASQWIGDVRKEHPWYTDPAYAKYHIPGQVKVPFWLTPVKVYVGPAWYQREIDVPQEWVGRPLRLFLERPHWKTTAWWGSTPLGSQDSLSTPHEYTFQAEKPGKQRLTLRVDNRLQTAVGVNAHSVSDHTQTNWNGIVGRLELRPVDTVRMEDVQVYPDVHGRKARVVAVIRNEGGSSAEGVLSVQVRSRTGGRGTGSRPAVEVPFRFSGTTTSLEATWEFGNDLRLWDEYSPHLYEVEARVQSGGNESAKSESRTEVFGMRDFGTSGTQFRLNDRPVFLRGTLECCIFPLTGYPPTDVAPWRRIVQIARAHGLNHLRFHSWCPPEAAFQAADEEGFLFSIEVASWSMVVGEDPQYEDWLYAETDRILRAYGNHPSFCMMLYGNEPYGERKNAALGRYVNWCKKRDGRRLYSSGAGWPMIKQNQFHITPDPRIHHWGAGLKSRVNSAPPETTTDYRDYISKRPVPVVSHEIGQWCVYPNLEERSKYTGVTRAYNFDIFEDTLRAHGLADQARDFLLASGKLQTLLYKEEIESSLRTAGMGGFQLLDLHDFPGQGTALVGVLDPFWDPKGYVTAEEYRRFSGETVPLARLAKRVWTNDEELTASLEIAHFGPAPLKDVSVAWSLRRSDGSLLHTGTFPRRTLELGNGIQIGEIRASLAETNQPEKLVLSASLEGTPWSNSWDLWVYPSKVQEDVRPGITVTRRLDDAALQMLRAGGKVLLVAEAGAVKGDRNGPVPVGFSSIFWNTAWTDRQPPHTLGILCDPAHPALASFPTEYHSNWQWWYPISRSQFMILDTLPRGLRPIVQIIDDWVTNRRLGLVFEAKLEGGSLLVSSIDLEGQSLDPVTRQLRQSLLSYMASPAFAPVHEVRLEELSQVLQLAGN